MIATLFALLAIITAPYAPVSYSCNGVTAAFAVTFPYQDLNHVVAISTTGAGVATTLSYTTDYTLSVVSTLGTATLTLTNPAVKCPTGSTLKISRVVPLTQPTNFAAQLSFRPELHTAVADLLEMQIQQVSSFVAPNSALSETLGGTGTTGITCTAGQVATSNGTSFSCLPLVPTCPAGQLVTANGSTFSCTVQTVDYSTNRVSLALAVGTGDTTLTSLGMGAITAVSSGNIAYTSDAVSDTTRQMVKGAVVATSTAASWSNVTLTRRQYLPKFVSKVYVPSLGTANGQDRVIFAGLKSTAPTTTGTGSECANQSNTNIGAWICYANATIASYASGTNWVYVRDDGVTALNTDSGIAVTTGVHTLVVDYSIVGQVTMTVDGAGAQTFTTNLGTASVVFGPVISCGTWATLASYSCSTPGFQVTQTF